MKTQGEFLNELEDALKYLNPKDRSEVLKHYRDKINTAIDYGETEQKVIATMPSPEKIAEEIYHSKGITYLEKRKKEYKRKSIAKAIFSGIMLFILFNSFIAVSYFFGKFLIHLFILAGHSFSLFDFVDTSTLFLFNISYILILIIVYIYVIDLFYIMIMYFLAIILDCIHKEVRDYPFMEFTISGTIQKHIKMKKFLPKMMLIFACCLLVFGIMSYASKGYLYRSMNNTITTRQKEEIIETVSSIEINENSAFIKVLTSSDVDTVVLSYGSEFEEKIDYQIQEGKLIITPKKPKKFDPFGLLNEPQQIIEVIIPKNYQLDQLKISFNGGTLDIVDTDSILDVTLYGSDFVAAITRSTFHTFTIEGLEMNLALENNVIDTINVKMQSGRFCAVNDQYQTFTLGNYLGNIILQNIKFNDATIENTSGKAAIDKLSTNHLTYKSVRSQDYFQDNVFQSFTLHALPNANVELDRLIVRESLNIIEDAGYVKINSCKTPKIEVSGENGKNSFYNIGGNIENIESYDESLKEYIHQYNNTTINLAQMNVHTTSGSMTISQSKLSILNVDIKKTTFTMNISTIQHTDIIATDANMNLADFDGLTISVNATKGSFMFYNDNITSDILLTLKTQNTAIGLGDNIKQSS